LSFHGVGVNSYFASVAADFIRHKLLESGTSFTFETVMSSPDKAAFLKKAQVTGFRTYLYYVATEDPIINISRVRNRVRLGGHPVPEDKIIARYGRSLGLLADAIRFTNRAYIFDNSKRRYTWLAEVTEGKVLKMKTDSMPAWFKEAVWDKLMPTEAQEA
jgi:predicted ABC-type ATPase